MGSFDGFGDALAYVTAKEQTDIEEVVIAYRVDGWIPTRGSQLTTKLQRPEMRLALAQARSPGRPS